MNFNKKQKTLFSRFGNNVKLENTKAYYHLTGQLNNWEDSVQCGLISADKHGKHHVVNDIKVKNCEKPPMIIPSLHDNLLDNKKIDVLIIGAGITGCAIARELSKWNIKVLLIEKEYDVALHASSRNDGMVHPGIDIMPGYLKKKLNNIGNRLYDKVCSELEVPFERTGQYLCFKKSWYAPLLFLSKIYWSLSGAGYTKVYSKKKMQTLEPYISDDVKCGLFFERAGIVCPYGLTIAYAENAVQNGVELCLNTAVTKIETSNNEIKAVETNRGTVYPKIVVNAAGVFSDDIAEMASDRFFSIHPRKGTNAILDKSSRKFINTIYSMIGTQSKSAHTKGGGIVGTVDGNVLIGPDAIETHEKENFATNIASIENSFAKHKNAGPWLSTSQIITYFTGIRAASYEEDFIVEKGRSTKNIVHAAAIQSPGLTAAPAISLKIEKIVIAMLKEKSTVEKNKKFNPHRVAIKNPKTMTLNERNNLIKTNPDYGEIVCRCEEVSRGEIIEALHRAVPCQTVDGIKRRVRPGMGRCQGGFCGPLIVKIIADEFGLKKEEVMKAGEGSRILFGDK